MSYNPIATAQKFEATLITATSSKPFDDVLTSIYASIGSPDKVGEWPKMVKNILSDPHSAQEQFSSTVESLVGPHGFMIFQV